MHRDVKSAKAGQYICVSLKGVLRNEIKRGMVLVADKAECKIAVREFWAVVNIFHSPTTVRVGFEPFLHVDQARQSVKILEIIKLTKGRGGSAGQKENVGAASGVGEEEQCLRTGDRAHIRVRFLARPEYIRPQAKLLFREGRVKAAGRVLPKAVDAPPQTSK